LSFQVAIAAQDFCHLEGNATLTSNLTKPGTFAFAMLLNAFI
jgi:hypothetical protein